jgi:hypothetical protein
MTLLESILGIILGFLLGTFMMQVKFGIKVAQHDVKIDDINASIVRLCSRIEQLIEQNGNLIIQNTTLINKLGSK